MSNSQVGKNKQPMLRAHILVWNSQFKDKHFKTVTINLLFKLDIKNLF